MADRAIIHRVLVEYEVETNLGGHRPQVLKATVLDHSQAKVFDGGTFRHPLAASDNRVLRTRTWLKRNIKI